MFPLGLNNVKSKRLCSRCSSCRYMKLIPIAPATKDITAPLCIFTGLLWSSVLCKKSSANSSTHATYMSRPALMADVTPCITSEGEMMVTVLIRGRESTAWCGKEESEGMTWAWSAGTNSEMKRIKGMGNAKRIESNGGKTRSARLGWWVAIPLGWKVDSQLEWSWGCCEWECEFECSPSPSEGGCLRLARRPPSAIPSKIWWKKIAGIRLPKAEAGATANVRPMTKECSIIPTCRIWFATMMRSIVYQVKIKKHEAYEDS